MLHILYTVTAPALLTDCLQVSCDEFPFNSALEGGAGNARVMAVPTREQQYQGSLQSSITNLRRDASNGKTVWKGASNRMCDAHEKER